MIHAIRVKRRAKEGNKHYLEGKGGYKYSKKQRTSLKQVEIKIHWDSHDPAYKDTQWNLGHFDSKIQRLVQTAHGTTFKDLVNNTHHKHGNLRGRTQRYSEGDVLLQSAIFC